MGVEFPIFFFFYRIKENPKKLGEFFGMVWNCLRELFITQRGFWWKKTLLVLKKNLLLGLILSQKSKVIAHKVFEKYTKQS